ncbi:MAG: hypothetical protein M0P94_03895 [Candidatus Absconditabacterales bacterium]|nr:hypothetical protein [Candidatus Absconditabacterales bacterium]
MERFIIFIMESESKLLKRIRERLDDNSSSELFLNSLLDMLLNQFLDELLPNEMYRKRRELSQVGFVTSIYANSPQRLNEYLNFLQEEIQAETLLVIDNKSDVCFIYNAMGDIAFIKENIMPIVGDYYQVVFKMDLFISEFRDLRKLNALTRFGGGYCLN